MKDVEILLPKLGESIVQATVVEWLKKVGDFVQLDEPLVEVSTDKVNSEIPSPIAGVITQIVAQKEDLVEVGGVLALIQSGSATEKSAAIAISTAATCPLAASSSSSAEKMKYYSPAVLRLAQENGLNFQQLTEIPHTGSEGRLSKKDLEAFLAAKMPSKEERKHHSIELSSDAIAASGKGNVELLKMSHLRKAIAENMVRSFYEAPHASLVSEIDVTHIMQKIQREKEAFVEAHGVKLTITSFLVKAIAKAAEQYPMLNSSLDKDTIVMKRYINIGIAVNVDKGLLVPVVKNCQNKDIVEIAKDISQLSQKARTQKLLPSDVAEGSITLTNFGMTGTLIGVPIIRYPEVAIIGAGAIQKRVVVREDDSLAIRSMLYITLTFDHRVIDGIYGCEFLAALKQQLEAQV